MLLEFDNRTPIFEQLAEKIQDAILENTYLEDQQIPSTTEMALTLKINPATALKGVNILVDEGIVYKKRGLGMFVANGAKEKIHAKRKQEFFSKYIEALLEEAKKLGISREDLITMIREAAK